MRTDKALLAFKLLLLIAVLCIAFTMAAKADECLTVLLVQARGGLRVHDEPSTDSPVHYLLDDCSTVVKVDEMEGWVLVGWASGSHGAIGWVVSDYLK